MRESAVSTEPLQEIPKDRLRQGSSSGQSAAYSLRSIALDRASESDIAAWQAVRSQYSTADPVADPGWLRGYFENQASNLTIYSLYDGGELCGLAPFLWRPWPMKFYLGDKTIAEFPLTRFRLLGGSIDFPENEPAYDLLFSELLKPEKQFQALYLEEVPVDSFLWEYIHTSPLIRKSSLLYAPETPAPRPVLRLQGSFEHYFAKFNSKHRNTLTRKIKKLREGALGEMRLERYERPEDVSTFLDSAVGVSRKTYQWTLHQRGLSATDLIRRRLSFAASQGWMRSYLLFCGGVPVAFLLGYQHGGRFYLDEIGFDPELAKHSVGTVLQLLTVEDLFQYNRPEIFDLQDYGGYKEELSTESYLQGKLFLFRRNPYAHFLRTGHHGCQVLNRVLSSSLDRLGLKARLKQRMRGWGRSK